MENTEVNHITEQEAKELRELMENLQRQLQLGLLPDPDTHPAPQATVYTTRLSNTTYAPNS